jgi:beta-N-acetylhexosaminidase
MDINKFSNQQLAGQRLMAGFDGTELNDDLKFLIDSLKVGGIVLFSRNIQHPEQVQSLCNSVQEYAKSCGQPPLFIAIDQEGGQVARLRSPFFTEFPGNSKIRDETEAKAFANITAAELKQIGVNMNFAPVMDTAPEGIQSVMAERAFGGDPERVSRLGVKIIETLQKNGVMATAKHFPGIGRTVLDSHFDMPMLDTDLDDLISFDLVPFQDAIDYGVAVVMLSHIRYDKIEPDLPASLSPQIAKKLLRDRMGFGGVVITDDLDMGAIKKHYDIQVIIPMILSADIDIALICHKGPAIEEAFMKIQGCLETSQDITLAGEAAVQRIMDLKQQYL